ncbi:lachesin-like [Ctenocephalides felis]|uniref:lachesin-like n=1 Tax=Ctenocephalides felis TaxID=7515 RepID=UPI000E6E5304|nr:lachesin-like [Ctenocephalides felis]
MKPEKGWALSKGRIGPSYIIKWLFVILIYGQFAHGEILEPPEIEPEFLAPLGNQTATQGRDVTFTCIVNHLGPYRVAWIKSDSKAILAIHTHMVAHDPRLSVTHNGHDTWRLHVTHVRRADSGAYMCQINTDPMRNQMGYLDVVVPPDILNDDENDAGGSDVIDGSGIGPVSLEGGTVKLRCAATGVPPPTVSWRREDSKNIVHRADQHREKSVSRTVSGDTLILHNIQRSDMGAYLCIASNGVPPSVSKRFIVQVHFHPAIRVANQLVGAPAGSDVTLQCHVEASPKAMNSWYRDSGDKILPSSKHMVQETRTGDYMSVLTLTVRELRAQDFGGYICASVNALGKAEGGIRLQELQLPKSTSTTTPRTRPPAPRPVATKKPPSKSSSSSANGQQSTHGHQSGKGSNSHSSGNSKGQRDRDWSGLIPPPFDVTTSSAAGGRDDSENEIEGDGSSGANSRRPPGWVTMNNGCGKWSVVCECLIVGWLFVMNGI